MNRPGIVVSAIVGVALLLGSFLGLLQAQTGGDVRTDEVTGVPVTLYSTGKDRPTVIVAHGFSSSTAMMDPLARGLMRAGFTVVSLDFPGHGRNPAPLDIDADGSPTSTSELTDALTEVLDWAAEQPEVDPARLALLGHSMGAGAVVDVAVDDAQADRRITATAALSLPSADGIPFGETSVPSNLLLLYGTLESEQFKDAAWLGLQKAYRDARPFITYGDMTDGSARRAQPVPGSEHITILYSGTTLALVTSWLGDAFGYTPVKSQMAPVLIYAAIALVAGGLLLGPVGLYLLGDERRRAWQRRQEAKRIRGPRVIAMTAVASAIASFGAWLTRPLQPVIPLAVGGYLAAFFLIAGGVTLAWWTRRELPSHGWPFTTRRSWRGAAAATLVAVVAVVVPGTMSWASFSLVGGRVLIVLFLAAVFTLYFGADELLVRRTSASRRLGLAVLNRLIVVAALLASIPFLGAPGFLILLLPVLFIFLVVLAGYAAIVSERRNPYAAAVLVQAIPAAILVGTVFPLVS